MPGAIPIVRLRGLLLVAIQVELSDRLVAELRRDLGREIERGEVHGVVLELSGVDTFDTYIARSIRDIAQIARLMGAETIVTGLDPGIAVTLVEMGMHLDGVRTTLDLASALSLLARDRRAVGVPGGDDELALDEARHDDDDLFDLSELDD